MYSLSTSWNAGYVQSPSELIDRIKDLGFRYIELSFTLPKDWVERIIKLLSKTDSLKVSSIHNFCPIPDGISPEYASPDIFSLSSLDESERKTAVRWTKNTIATANRLNAQAVILHLGKVDMKDKTMTLFNLYEKQFEFQKLRAQFVSERKKRSSRHMKPLYRSLDEILGYSQKLGVKIGIENRYRYKDIPIIEELHQLFTEFEDQNLCYWHDIGHAQVFEWFGYSRHLDFLETFSERMIGIHLHDVRGIKDHLVPGDGDFDFSILRPYLKMDLIKVFEPHWPATAQRIIEGYRYIQSLYEGG